MKIVLANSQMFQALYIDTEAEKAEDKIVLIEEMVESLPEAQQILTSLMKEPYYGMVISGSNIAITKFRSKIYDIDHKDQIGKEEMGEILAQIAQIAFDQKCEVVFFKGPIEHKGIPEQMKNVSVALDLKGIFDPEKIKNAGKQFWDNLIGVDKELEKRYQKIDLKEHKKLMDYVEKNEKSIESLKEALKERGIKAPNIDNMLSDMDVQDIEEYLGPNYSNLKFYEIKKDLFLTATKNGVKPGEEPFNPGEDQKPEENFPYGEPKKPMQKDPRLALIQSLTAPDGSALKTRNNTVMEKTNIADVGMNGDYLVLALKKAEDYDLNWWPKQPSKGTMGLLDRYDWLKNPKDNANQNKKSK
jgi:hypothetical protein